ncbi:hypothetical protein [Flavobacterium sp. UBA6135]|uniref:hypothetical protein n=1 Tax=Flavobacterium sp. UBA6135 TaxID=1946553 RepID=UPI0025BD32A4|nr:hypothetical protein [Flavobacterium sp. UBA6135]
MKNILQKYGLIYATIWLLTGFIASVLFPKNIIFHFYLGLGILFTLYFLKSNNLKIK